jgi:hypothetical protein
MIATMGSILIDRSRRVPLAAVRRGRISVHVTAPAVSALYFQHSESPVWSDLPRLQ